LNKKNKRLINEVYPTGFLSIVSDTWNLWECINFIIRPLKRNIRKRGGKIIIRPDSGDPVKIICGDSDADTPEERQGVIELLWGIFQGTINDKGYRELDPHIGAIYGDAITLDRCETICEKLLDKGFASTNIVFGVGSFTYQYNTRDTFGFALKSTMAQNDGKEIKLFKDPITDDGTKKSNTGVVAIQKRKGELVCKDNLSFGHREPDLLSTIFFNGAAFNTTTLKAIRKRINNEKSNINNYYNRDV